jgi:peptidoglycan hydrolase-like protein with peptidoglycan-binding domain
LLHLPATGAIRKCIHQEASDMTRILFLAGLILMALVAGTSAQQPIPSVTGKITIIWKKPADITVSPAELPSGDYDVRYPNVQMVANGGSEPYEFIVAGGLPPGLTLNSNGLLSGVPVEEGAFAFTVGVIDKDDFKGKRNYSITIEANEVPTPTAEAPCPYGTIRFGADCVKDATVATPQPPVYPTPPTTQPPVYPTATLYPREVQTELKRVGCLAGRVDGIWGNGSRSALRKFYGRAGLSAAGTEPSQVVLSDVQSQGGRICPAVYVAPPPKKKKKKTTYKPKCSKIKYAYTSGNTCKCSGGRNFNGKYCVKTQIASPPPQNEGPTIGDVIGAGLCIAAQAQCNKKGGYFNSNSCSCSYSGGGGGGGYTPKCYKECDDCPTVCE